MPASGAGVMVSGPTCYLVVGPECSGTRLVTRLLIAGGCSGCATAEPKAEYGGWPQKWDAVFR